MVLALALPVILGNSKLVAQGFDTGVGPEALARLMADGELTAHQGPWVRLRGVHTSMVWRGEDAYTEAPLYSGAKAPPISERRKALATLHKAGFHVVPFLRWSGPRFPSGGRTGSGHRLAIDLREAYEYGRAMAFTYGDWVPYWEIDNEPDIGFGADNAEAYAAFFKAVSLGIASGNTARNTAVAAGTWPGDLENVGPCHSEPLMAPMALPPGPFWESLLANDLLPYTAGFNYHYYGYAEDFSGIYHLWQAAVTGGRPQQETAAKPDIRKLKPELLANNPADLTGGQDVGSPGTSLIQASRFAPQDLGKTPPIQVSGLSRQVSAHQSPSDPRPFPVFITEFGYGTMDEAMGKSVAGRVRQWQWFRSVSDQLRELGLTRSMAFYLQPYLERNFNEFGLLMSAPISAESAKIESPNDSGTKSPPPSAPEPPAEALAAKAAELAQKQAERAREAARQLTPKLPFAVGTLVIYNFTDRTVTGTLELPPHLQPRDRSQISDVCSQNTGANSDSRGNHDAPKPEAPASGHPTSANRPPASALHSAPPDHGPPTSGLRLPPSDFGLTHTAPWMAGIGRQIGKFYASPALAYLLDRNAKNPITETIWQAPNNAPSPIIIDFLPGAGLIQSKPHAGYVVDGIHQADLAPLDISDEPTESDTTPTYLTLQLAAGERREIPVFVFPPSTGFFPTAQAIHFRSESPPTLSTNWVSHLLPPARGMRTAPVLTVDSFGNVQRKHEGELSQTLEANSPELTVHRDWLLSRPLAAEEPVRIQQGPWVTTQDLTIARDHDKILITLHRASDSPLGAAIVELPLPSNGTLPSDAMLQLNYRQSAETPVSMSLSVGIVMENGNLFKAPPTASPSSRTNHFWVHGSSLTPSFYGRHALPWTYEENQPAALSLIISAKAYPATLEISNITVQRWLPKTTN